jgi:hypothetical protein
MAIKFQRNAGMLVLGLWLLLNGLGMIGAVPMPGQVMAVLALVAGVLILIGR